MSLGCLGDVETAIRELLAGRFCRTPSVCCAVYSSVSTLPKRIQTVAWLLKLATRRCVRTLPYFLFRLGVSDVCHNRHRLVGHPCHLCNPSVFLQLPQRDVRFHQPLECLLLFRAGRWGSTCNELVLVEAKSRPVRYSTRGRGRAQRLCRRRDACRVVAHRSNFARLGGIVGGAKVGLDGVGVGRVCTGLAGLLSVPATAGHVGLLRTIAPQRDAGAVIDRQMFESNMPRTLWSLLALFPTWEGLTR